MSNIILTQEQADKSVEKLLEQYQEYMNMYNEVAKLTEELQDRDSNVSERIEELQLAMSDL